MRLTLVLLVSAALPLAAQTRLNGRVDSVFRQYASTATPGCAVGVAHNGRVLLERAVGMADLERGVALTSATILEAGSVSKQFTAAAVLLLARDGKLSLDDPVRRWVPEVPDFGRPITIRHLMHHTSGLRDWGSIAGVAGWPRNTRALGHAHVLQIIGRLRELNFPPGTEYEYSNSNYNLLAIVAERASGEPLPAFTQRRIFAPLGMRSTSWRDDAMRVVPGRALSYSRDSAGWRGERAIENIYGNCCLLTTVGDLLKWNAAFDSTRLAGAGFRAEQERRGVLTGGRTITYAAGLFVDTYRGQPYVAHSGATAGYRAYAVRYPSSGVSVAVLCNAGNADAETMGDSVAGTLVPFAARATPAPPPRAAVPPAALADKAGLYRNLRDMQSQRFVVRDGRLETERGVELIPTDATTFHATSGGYRVLFTRRPDGHYNPRIVTQSGDTVPADWVPEADTARAALAAYAGLYESPEAETTVRIAVDSASGGTLVVTRVAAPGGPWRFRAIYRDGFAGPPGVVVFMRDRDGRITGLRYTTGRVRNLRFDRVLTP